MQDADELSPQRDAYREHMRAMAAARQAAEREHDRRHRTPEEQEEADRVFEEELARIHAEHQVWLRAHGFVEAPLPSRRKSLPPDAMARQPAPDDRTRKARPEGDGPPE